MSYRQKLRENSDSLIGLLAAQCADLESLFELAQQETRAAGQKDFEVIFNIVTERARIGEKLETYQRQIAELRNFLAGSEGAYENASLTERINRLAEETIAQDTKTRLLLSETREETSLELRNLAAGKRSVSVYMQEMQKGLSYNESI
jgi:flagellar biosynthesis/type III secretory pathway chaperone